MSRVDPRHASRDSALSTRVVRGLAAATAICLVSVFGGMTLGGTPDDRAVAASETAPRGRAATGTRAGAVRPEVPRRALLPSGKVVPVRPVSTTRNGFLDVPGNINVSGWWRGGSRLGDPFGSALLAAHVDSTTQGLGPYAELLTVRAGQRIVLTSAHLRQKYVVRSLRLLDKGPLSAHPWVYSPRGRHRVTMVTCAGHYVRSKGGYQKLAVVTATAVGQPTRRGS